MKNNQKGAVNVWLVILVIVIVVVGGYFAFQNLGTLKDNQEANNVTKDWKTYQNEKFKIKLNYPNSLVPAIESSNFVEFYDEKDVNQDKVITGSRSYFSIGLSMATSIESQIESERLFAVGKGNEPANIINKEIVVVDDQKGLKLTIAEPKTSNPAYISIEVLLGNPIQIPLPDDVFTNPGEPRFSEFNIVSFYGDFRNKDIIEKIVETVDFLNSQNTDETANWQTYRNEKYKFEIKYPPGPSPANDNQLINPDTTLYLVASAINTDLNPPDIDKAVTYYNEVAYPVHKFYGYGEKNPQVKKLTIAGQEARLVIPNDKNRKQVGLMIVYPKPEAPGKVGYSYSFLHLLISEFEGDQLNKVINSVKFLPLP